MRKVSMSVYALLLVVCAAEAKEPPRTKFDGKFVDDFITAAMKRDGIPGAAFVFVKDGRIVYMKGYGVGNVETKSPVDPERTVWRIGSISKTFTATAVMQLADRGVVDVRADVNRYLTRVKVPDTYPLPVTVADLLMHTAGFDEIRPGTQAASADGVLPLDEFLRTKLVRVRPPGTTLAYSTYGITLAGALVEDVTHQPFAGYLHDHVFAPLGMTRTNVGAPPAGDVAVGYEMRDGKPEAQAWEWYHTTPASSVNSTVADMAKYMIAHLDQMGGKLFSPATAKEMHRQHLTADPHVTGVTLGFWEDSDGSLRVIEHGGNMAGFSAQMTLIPSDNAGFFVISHLEGSHLRDDLKWGLLEHLYPA
ncbi:MAG TPA: serine hydrolase domain-containing protein, partial [Thermoanaerobaculia bacterium]|nr:serine hydrolase domain-containing protein [Thermoanaerobaculia bacterium]